MNYLTPKMPDVKITKELDKLLYGNKKITISLPTKNTIHSDTENFLLDLDKFFEEIPIYRNINTYLLVYELTDNDVIKCKLLPSVESA